jgi:hypothetical protein
MTRMAGYFDKSALVFFEGCIVEEKDDGMNLYFSGDQRYQLIVLSLWPLAGLASESGHRGLCFGSGEGRPGGES